MAEVAASVLTLATVGVKLSRTLYQVGYKTVSAGHNINRIATNVTLFSSVLKHVGATFRDSRSLHTQEAVELVQQIVEESELLFKEITSTVISATNKNEEEPVVANGRRSRRLSVLHRVKWYFEQPKVDYVLAQLEYLKTTLSVLMQTLSLAAFLASQPYDNEPTEQEKDEESKRVEAERTHIETLVIAQHLSVVVLDQIQDRKIHEHPQSSDESESTVESRGLKLLTSGASPSTSVVRLGDGHLGFLERRGSGEGDGAVPHVSKSQIFIDELLCRWTRSPEEPFNANDYSEKLDSERHGFPFGHESPLTPNGENREDDEDETADSLPNLQLHPVESPETIKPETLGAVPSPRLLDPNATPRPRGSARSSPSPMSDAPGMYPSPSSQIPANPQANSKVALARTFSNPEGDGAQLQLNTFHDQHGLERQERPPSTVPSLASGPTRSPASPAPLPMPHSLSTLAYYTRSPVPSSTGGVIASPQPGYPAKHFPPTYPANYRPPYVTSHCSSSSGSDSESVSPPSTPRDHRRRFSQARRDSHTSRRARDSGVGSGLGIPWRIRISGAKYFDFRDEKLVGPRTPLTPTEPVSWMYSHDNACTEISKRWVCEDAIREKRLPFVENHEEQDFAMGMGLGEDDGSWKIHQPLKFNEVEALVERTVDIYRAKTMAPVLVNPARPGSPRYHQPPKTHVRLNPPQYSPSQGQAPHLPSPQQQHNIHNRFSTAQRSVSFNGASPQYPPYPVHRSALNGTNSDDRSPRNSAEYPHYSTQPHIASPQGHGPSPGQAWLQNPRFAGFNNAPPEHWREQQHRRDREHRRAHKEYDRSHDRDNDRNSRPNSRSGPSGKYRDKEREKDKKRSGSSMASTIAKIGGLAAMLEGLDLAF